VDGASTIELATEAVELSYSYGSSTAFVILSGNNWYVPLVQRLQRAGHFVLMATLETPSRSDHLPTDVVDAFLNARFLLDGGMPSSPASDRSGAVEPPEPQKPTAVKVLDGEAERRTLEIIERYFGQYEEVYLTPLLRKLSEILGDDDEEPKTLINTLEESGAVWLEKRRGFPHNYTVLLMNPDHPDVLEVKEAMAGDEDDYGDDDYEDYDDSYDDDDGDIEDDDFLMDEMDDDYDDEEEEDRD